MQKLLCTALMGLALAAGSANAQVYVRIAPPPVVIEHPPVRPGPNFIWIRGFYRWDGARYVWVPGHWVVPPRRHTVWVDGHWVHRRGGWFWVEGHWRG
ncbi:MAG TPA: YXWGXW repeat-containing protein [Bryobacteraceae bacterium]|jgi:hypothetical protein|nr:YXWGXW repeat-containing protein [Bryobacteraceae bacterium]